LVERLDDFAELSLQFIVTTLESIGKRCFPFVTSVAQIVLYITSARKVRRRYMRASERRKYKEIL